MNERGVALIVVLWVVTMLGAMTLLYGRETLFAVRIQSHRGASLKAEALAEAGLYRAMAVLSADLPDYDASPESWYNDADSFGGVYLSERHLYRVTAVDPDQETTTVRYGLVDECSKININTANKAQLQALPNAEESIVDAIIDWRDDNEVPEPLGAEDEYYGSLPEPYLTKNANFDTVEELLLVRDVTVAHLFGEDTNRNGMLDPNENDGDENEPIDDRDGELDRGWWPYITVYSLAPNTDAYGEPRINVNSASKEAFQESLSEYLNDNQMDDIIAARDDAAFNNVGQLLDVQRQNGGGQSINRSTFMEVCDFVTTSDDEQQAGLININTAPLTVLKTFYPNQPEIADRIVEYRESGDGPFGSIGDLLSVDGINQDRFKNVAAMVTVRSDVFSARSAGIVEKPVALREIYAVIDRGADPPAFRLWKTLR